MKMVAVGATAEQYEALNEAVGVTGEDAPDGLIIHMAGVTDDGMVIVDVWESPEKLKAFFDERLDAALADSEMDAGEPEIHQLHAMIPQGAGTGENVMVFIEVDAGPEVYDEMASQMPAHSGDGSDHPVTAHIAGVTDDGKMFIVDLWESPEAFARFAEEQIAPAAPEGMEVNPQIVPVHNVVRGNASVSS
jgi:hypothetical protein